jgi:dCTP deaminase
MLLADVTIERKLNEGAIQIEPFHKSQLQPAGYDVTLGSDFMVFKSSWLSMFHMFWGWEKHCIDPKQDNTRHMKSISIPSGEPFVLHPHQFALGATRELIGVNESYACELGGKSSLARLGLIVHATAGFIDPGNHLRITFEFFNFSWWRRFKLWPGMHAGQVFFIALSEPCVRPYGSKGLNSKYYGDMKVKPSMMHRNFSNGR